MLARISSYLSNIDFDNILVWWLAGLYGIGLVIVIAGGISAGGIELRKRWRERNAQYLRGRIRELRDIPAWVEETRGAGGVTASEYEDDLARGGLTWTTTTSNPEYAKTRKELSRVGFKLRRKGFDHDI